MNPTLHVLTLWQPWASLVACGTKTIETRHWPAPSRIIGARIVIHAAATKIPVREMTKAAAWWVERAEEALGVAAENWTRDLPFGAAIATAVVLGSIPTGCLLEDPWGDFSEGRYGWQLYKIRKLPEPIPLKGRQGIWTTNAIAP